jgi:aconitase B
VAFVTSEFSSINKVVGGVVRHKYASLARHKCHTTYFRPDADAEYAAVHQIDLTHVGSFIVVRHKYASNATKFLSFMLVNLAQLIYGIDTTVVMLESCKFSKEIL